MWDPFSLYAVLKKSSKRPAKLRGLSQEKFEHDRDIENMQ